MSDLYLISSLNQCVAVQRVSMALASGLHVRFLCFFLPGPRSTSLTVPSLGNGLRIAPGAPGVLPRAPGQGLAGPGLARHHTRQGSCRRVTSGPLVGMEGDTAVWSWLFRQPAARTSSSGRSLGRCQLCRVPNTPDELAKYIVFMTAPVPEKMGRALSRGPWGT